MWRVVAVDERDRRPGLLEVDEVGEVVAAEDPRALELATRASSPRASPASPASTQPRERHHEHGVAERRPGVDLEHRATVPGASTVPAPDRDCAISVRAMSSASTPDSRTRRSTSCARSGAASRPRASTGSRSGTTSTRPTPRFDDGKATSGSVCLEAVASHAALALRPRRRCGAGASCTPSATATRRCSPTRSRRSTTSRTAGSCSGSAPAGTRASTRAYGIPFPPAPVRLRQLDEAIQCVRLLLTEDSRRLRGRVLRPHRRAVRPEAGAGAAPALDRRRRREGHAAHRRAARRRLEHPVHAARRLPAQGRGARRALRARGRDPATIEKSREPHARVARRRVLRAQFGGIADCIRPSALMGSPQQMVDRIGEYADAGADWVILALRGTVRPRRARPVRRRRPAERILTAGSRSADLDLLACAGPRQPDRRPHRLRRGPRAAHGDRPRVRRHVPRERRRLTAGTLPGARRRGRDRARRRRVDATRRRAALGLVRRRHAPGAARIAAQSSRRLELERVVERASRVRPVVELGAVGRAGPGARRCGRRSPRPHGGRPDGARRRGPRHRGTGRAHGPARRAPRCRGPRAASSTVATSAPSRSPCPASSPCSSRTPASRGRSRRPPTPSDARPTDAAAAALGLPALRDATLAQVRDDPRARHVVTENARGRRLRRARFGAAISRRSAA